MLLSSVSWPLFFFNTLLNVSTNLLACPTCYHPSISSKVEWTTNGKRARGREFSTNPISQNLVNGTLPVVTVCIDGTPCRALVDTGCTQSLVCKSCCWEWMRKATCMFIVGGGALTCCGIKVVHVSISVKPAFTIEVLVVGGDLLGFDWLLGLQLGGVSITCTGEVTFLQHDRPNCAAITITELNFNADYDEITQKWTASWKWVGDQPPVTLRNRLAEYPAPAQIREEYERELQM